MKIKNLLFILIIMLIGFVGINNVKADSTVLYDDGTLIINEKDVDRDGNILEHGEITAEYQALSSDCNYIFESRGSVLWNNNLQKIKKVLIGQKIEPINTSHWFENAQKLEYADLTNLDTRYTESMSYMFYWTLNLNTLIGLNNWNTSNVTDMRHMFTNSDELTSINGLENWNTSKVTDMSYMFDGTNLDSLSGISNWDTSNVTNMSGMFYYAKLNNVNLSNWNVSNVISMKEMFNGSSVLDIGDISNWNVSKVTDMSSMFSSSGSGETWSIGTLATWNTSNVENMSGMFAGIGASATTVRLDLTNWNTSKVTDMSGMFANIGKSSKTIDISIGDISNWNTSSVQSMKGMFKNSGKYMPIWNLVKVTNWDTSKVTDVSEMFYNVGYTSAKCQSFGILKLHGNVDVQDFATYSSKLNGNVVIFNSLKNYLYKETNYSGQTDIIYGMFYGTATSENANVNIYYMNATAKSIANEIVGLYGLNGSVTQGNILVQKLSLEDAIITGISDKKYNGNYQEQNISVSIFGKQLQEGIDYEVVYSNNQNIGTAEITITGLGEFVGSISKTFKINPIDISSAEVLGLDDINRIISVKYNDQILEKDTDYTLTATSTYAGVLITITGDGVYTGTIKKLIEMNVPTKLTLKLTSYNSVNFSWNKVKNADGYFVYYKAEGYNYALLCTTTNLNCKKTKMLAGKKYYFKVVPYVIIDSEKVQSGSYSTKSIYALKKMNLPTVVKYNNSQVRVKWTKINGATKYQIARSLYKTKNFTTLKAVSNSYSSYRFKTTKNKTYYYKVRACNGSICGPWSNIRTYKLK